MYSEECTHSLKRTRTPTTDFGSLHARICMSTSANARVPRRPRKCRLTFWWQKNQTMNHHRYCYLLCSTSLTCITRRLSCPCYVRWEASSEIVDCFRKILKMLINGHMHRRMRSAHARPAGKLTLEVYNLFQVCKALSPSV